MVLALITNSFDEISMKLRVRCRKLVDLCNIYMFTVDFKKSD